MSSFFLAKGLVINREAQLYEYISRGHFGLSFANIETGEILQIKESDFIELLSDGKIAIDEKSIVTKNEVITSKIIQPDTSILVSDLPEKYARDVERKISYIKAVQKENISRGQLKKIDRVIELHARILDDKNPPSSLRLSSWMKKFQESNSNPCVLISGYFNRKQPKRISKENEELILKSIEETYLTTTQDTQETTYEKYKEHHKIESKKITNIDTQVSISTLNRRIREIDKFEITAARKGINTAQREFRMIKGHMHSEFPLQFVEADHTALNLIVIDDELFIPLGRPTFTVMKDRYTKVIVGMYLSFSPPSFEACIGALRHSLISHHKIYDIWPCIKNAWPSYGLAENYIFDNGPEFQSILLKKIIQDLGSDSEFNERRTPWHKPHIERFFGSLEQSFFESIPGRTFSSIQMKGEYNPTKDAVIRFSTIVYLLHKWCIDYYNIQPNSRTLIAPLDSWNESIIDFPPPLIPDISRLNMITGLPHNSKLSHEGLRFKWLTYSDPNGRLMDIYKKYKNDINLNYRVPMHNLGQIYVLDPDKHDYFTVPCTRPDYAEGLTLHQHTYIRKQCKSLNANNAMERLTEARGEISKTIKSEISTSKIAQKQKIARLSGMSSNSVIESQPQSINRLTQEKEISITQDHEIQTLKKLSWGI